MFSLEILARGGSTITMYVALTALQAFCGNVGKTQNEGDLAGLIRRSLYRQNGCPNQEQSRSLSNSTSVLKFRDQLLLEGH
jgi:hypothetical protein